MSKFQITRSHLIISSKVLICNYAFCSLQWCVCVHVCVCIVLYCSRQMRVYILFMTLTLYSVFTCLFIVCLPMEGATVVYVLLISYSQYGKYLRVCPQV